jgi:hypothetical protein
MTGISFVLTSCGRFDLLEQTLNSFFRQNSCSIAQFILVEDSGNAGVIDLLRMYPVEFEVIINSEKRGQIASIDSAYRRVTQPLIFHCEDDWQFIRSGFIEDSITIIEGIAEASMVNSVVPGVLEEMDAAFDICPAREWNGIRYRLIQSDAHPLWFGYSLNPGLRRTADHRAAGSFAAIGHESDLSLYFRRRGMSIAVLENRACTHIGEDRHVVDSIFPITESPAFKAYWRTKHK